MMQDISVYVHIPFCDYKCTFCDFATYVGHPQLRAPYAEALNTELESYEATLSGQRTTSVFLGGGTPTLLDPALLEELLKHIGRLAPYAPEAEITVESNPDTLEGDALQQLKAAGINRLSIGIQSLNDQVLASLHRGHTAATALDAVRRARNAGFTSISVDLIFGLPGQDQDDWTRTLRSVVDSRPDHISVYGLIVEDGALLTHQLKKGVVSLPTDDQAADMYELTMSVLSSAGYVHYEISNWARPGHQSIHNLRYWQHDQYLGLGVSAHGYLGTRRYANVRGLRHYLLRIQRGQSPVVHEENISAERARSDALIVGLRMTAGLQLDQFNKRFGGDVLADRATVVDRLLSQGLLELSDGHLKLTARAYLVANQVWQEFV